MKFSIFLIVLLMGSFGMAQSQPIGLTSLGPEPTAHQDGHPEGYPLVKGVVRRIDRANKKITIKHDEIPNLDMPGMTMPFAVSKPEMLDGLGLGSRILFSAEEVGGVLTAIWIERAP